jgi:hypothetical protein
MGAGPLNSICYSSEVLERIAKSLKPLGTNPLLVKSRRIRFERAATCTSMILQQPSLVPNDRLTDDLAEVGRTSKAIVREAGRLIKSQGRTIPNGIPDKLVGKTKPQPTRLRKALSKLLELFELTPETAEDGISSDLQPYLMIKGDKDEFDLRDLLVDIILGFETEENLDRTIRASYSLIKRADQGHRAAKRLRDNMVRKGHSGDAALNFWIDDMLNIFQKITGKPVVTRVGNVSSASRGIAYGPLIDFLDAAIEPLMPQLIDAGVLQDKLYGDAWRSRIRTAQKHKAQNSG